MRTPLKFFLAVLGGLAGIVAAALVLVWLGSRPSDSKSPTVAQAPVSQPAQANNDSPSPASPQNQLPLVTPGQTNTGLTDPNAMAAAPGAGQDASTNLIADWQDKFDAVLNSDNDDTNKAQQLLDIFPRLPPDAKVEAAQHLSNLVPDEDYAPLANLLTNATLSTDVLDVLLGDALNRPNSLKLPALLDVASNSAHPQADEAKDLLELYLDADYGTDWGQWRQKIAAWLKDNPDE
jgi:hypothetical protein